MHTNNLSGSSLNFSDENVLIWSAGGMICFRFLLSDASFLTEMYSRT